MSIRVSRGKRAFGGYFDDRSGMRALAFNGYNRSNDQSTADRASLPALASLQPTQRMQIELMVKPYALRDTQVLFSQWVRGAGGRCRLVVLTGGGAANRRIIVQFAPVDGSDVVAGTWTGSVSTLALETNRLISIGIDLTQPLLANRCTVAYDGVDDPAGIPVGILGSLVSVNGGSTTDYGIWPAADLSAGVPFFGEICCGNLWSRPHTHLERQRRAYEIAGIRIPGVDISTPVDRTGWISSPSFDEDLQDDRGRYNLTATPAVPVGYPARGPQLVQAMPEGVVDNDNACLNILHIGDSIEAGVGWDDADLPTAKIGARGMEYDIIRRTGIRHVRFIGTLTDPISVPSWWLPGLRQHDGISGQLLDDPLNHNPGVQTINQRLLILIAALQAAGTRIDGCFLGGGNNDLGHTYTGAQTAAHLASCLTTLFGLLPNVFVIVESSPPYTPVLAEWTAYHDAIPATIDTFIAAGRDVAYADSGGAMSQPGDLQLDLHPNRKGYAVRAIQRARKLIPRLRRG